MAIGNALVARHVQSGIVFHAALLPYACGCSTQTTSTINLKRSTLHPHEGQADRPNTPSDSVDLGSNPGPPARQSGLRGDISRCVRTRDIPAGYAGGSQSLAGNFCI